MINTPSIPDDLYISLDEGKIPSSLLYRETLLTNPPSSSTAKPRGKLTALINFGYFLYHFESSCLLY